MMDGSCEANSSTLVAGVKASKVFRAIDARSDAVVMFVVDWITRDDDLGCCGLVRHFGMFEHVVFLHQHRPVLAVRGALERLHHSGMIGHC